VKEYASLEGDLALSCRHDGLGTVECEVTVRQPSPPEWSIHAVLAFGAGAHLDRVADAVEASSPAYSCRSAHVCRGVKSKANPPKVHPPGKGAPGPQLARVVALTTGFGPPSAGNAYIYTATDDTLLAGSSTIGRRPTALPQFGNDAQSNLSHTCASTRPPTTTTTASTTTTTAPSSTTTPDATTVPADVAGESIANDPNGASGQTTLPRTGGSVPVLPLVLAITATLAGIALLVAPRQRRSRG
jgi:hypothetical protein